MDDRTNNTLDALADLFLTGTDEPSHPTPPAPPASPVPPRDLSLNSQEASEALSGPAPIKLAPKPKNLSTAHLKPESAAQFLAAHGEPPAPTLGEFDGLAGDLIDDLAALTADPSASDYTPEYPAATDAAPPTLRLAGQDHGSENENDDDWPHRRDTPAVGVAEAVLLGNLPGMAGPWLTQYGQLLAQQDGAVAILHVDADAIDLELIEPTSPPQPSADGGASLAPQDAGFSAAPSLRIPPGGYAGRDLVDVLGQLNAARVSPVQTVLIHLDATPDQLGRLLDIDYWTLLSGADDAAIVAGYSLLKKLLESDGRVARAHVGLMVVGSDHDAGQHAAGKLRSAAANFLKTPVELIGYQQKMIPARCRTLGRFEGLEELWPRLMAWLGALQPPTPAAEEVSSLIASDLEPPANASKPALPSMDHAVEVQPEPLQPETAGHRSQPAGDARSTFAQQTPRVPVAAAPMAPFSEAKPINGPHTEEPLSVAEADLFGLIDTDPHTTASIPGGLALEARCPSQPHTQLALDAMGRLHLLHRHDSADGDPPTPKEAIVELVAVRDWARQHRQLLQLTERGRRFDPDADPVLHLFTDRADLAVNLVARLGDLLKLHLLRNVAVGDQHTFFCTPLSA